MRGALITAIKSFLCNAIKFFLQKKHNETPCPPTKIIHRAEKIVNHLSTLLASFFLFINLDVLEFDKIDNSSTILDL